MTHPRHRLDAIIHNPTRFSIMAALMAADKAEFRFIRDTVELTDSVLSQHVTTLERAGYVKVTKGQVGRRPRTWLSATHAGRNAFDSHLALLNELAAAAERYERPAGGSAPHRSGSGNARGSGT